MNVILNVTVNLNVNVRGKRECEPESECKLNAPNPWPHCQKDMNTMASFHYYLFSFFSQTGSINKSPKLYKKAFKL